MVIRYAQVSDTGAVRQLFHKLLSNENDAIYNDEFLCPDGVGAAIKRNQIIIIMDHEQLVAALRFYKRKTRSAASLYQFAITDSYRGQHLLFKMLDLLGGIPIEVQCPIGSKFNEYYLKTNWTLFDANQKYNRYVKE
jgi:hypothetical protein